MKLTPHQILLKLGFNVPPDGLTINPSDLLLHEAVLGMAGRTIDLSRVPDQAFRDLHTDLAHVVAEWRGAPPMPTTDRSAEITRKVAMTVLTSSYNWAPPA